MTKLLFVNLFGAGGGGGGFVQDWFPVTSTCSNNSNHELEFYVTVGGRGGQLFSAGSKAAQSWFSNPAHLYVFESIRGSSSSITSRQFAEVATEGYGGTAGGDFATLAVVGNLMSL